jgi:rSAM/selenodomain-associated transferase 1
MNRLAVFARVPETGAVKTRLSPALPAPLAADLYGAMLADTLAAGQQCAVDERSVWWADALPPAGLADGWLPRQQGEGDLGARLESAFAALLADERDRALVIGSDAPAIEAAHLDRAFEALEKADVVLGPASDGGYWLIGMGRPHPALLAGIPWSTERVLEATLERARNAKLRVAHVAPLDDVDTPADVARLVGAYARPGSRACGTHVRDALRRMGLLP